MNQNQTNQSNTSGLKPLGRAVLVKPYEPEVKKGIIELLDSTQEKMVMTDVRVVVIEVGPACWPDEPPRAQVGDKVLIAKFAGSMTRGTLDGQVYRVVNDRDIYLQIIEEQVSQEKENG
jgi:co-chaperonin GroES (HSP10)